MRVLAVDPGYDRLGVAVVKKGKEKEELLYSGCLVTSREDTLTERLFALGKDCLLYTSPSPRDRTRSRMPSSA